MSITTFIYLQSSLSQSIDIQHPDLALESSRKSGKAVADQPNIVPNVKEPKQAITNHLIIIELKFMNIIYTISFLLPAIAAKY